MMASLSPPPAPVAAKGPQLRDIHLPPDPSWWPPAPGWWVLAVLVLAMLLAGAWLWRRQRRMARQRAQVLVELDRRRSSRAGERDAPTTATGSASA